MGLLRAVVAKGAFRTGDWAVYVPENALLPDDLVDELGLTGRLAGSRRNRVKAVRLRGELSQGIVCVSGRVADRDLAAAHDAGTDFSGELGITKWVPKAPLHMSGELVEAPDLLRWVEVENAKRHPDVFEQGEPVVATEKIHGTACLFTLLTGTGEEFVSSKNHGARRQGLAFAEDNLYWRSVVAHGVPEAARKVAERVGAARVGVFGSGVQDLGYGETGRSDHPGYAVFDISLDVDGTVTWSGGALHMREGLVVRPAHERYSAVLRGRAIAQFVSDDYLTRQGGTEYE